MKRLLLLRRLVNGIGIGLGVLVISVVALGWKKRHDGPFPTSQQQTQPTGQPINEAIHQRGQWEDDPRHDHGVYKGEQKGLMRHGQGTFIYPDKSTYIGEWKDGFKWAGTIYDKNGTAIASYASGVCDPKNFRWKNGEGWLNS